MCKLLPSHDQNSYLMEAITCYSNCLSKMETMDLIYFPFDFLSHFLFLGLGLGLE